MIGNRATRGPGEGVDHYQTKIVLGQIIDQTISPWVADNGGRALTMYEFPFIPLELEDYDDICSRCYVGDICLLIYNSIKEFKSLHNKVALSSWSDIQNAANTILNYEVDGKKGHSTPTEKKKNSIRDTELKKHYNIEVCRIPFLDKKSRTKPDTYDTLKEEVVQFYLKHVPRVIV